MNVFLDWLGFGFSGLTALGFLFVYSMVLEGEELTDAFGVHMSVMLRLKQFWLESPRRKNLAMWLANNGTIYCFMAAVIGFLLQLGFKRLFEKGISL